MALAMRTHTGETVTGERLNEARRYAASYSLMCAAAWLNDPDHGAPHVTTKMRGKLAAENVVRARRIERGECDHNFTIWQRMDYFLTGESVPFLSN